MKIAPWIVAACVWTCSLPAQAQIFSTPYPEPSTNAALHYHRALLAMGTMPAEQRNILAQPIWKSFENRTKEQLKTAIAKVVYEGRHALRAAKKATSCNRADFGLDYSDYGHGNDLPHCQPMVELGRLLTLAGIYAQMEQQWEKSATLLFDGLRMGRQMAHQPTLSELVVGVQILESNYFALAFWGSKCPESRLVKQAFLRLEAATESMMQPAFTFASEASIIERQMERVRVSFPDGPWAEMLLDSLGASTVADDADGLKAKAMKLATERGVPESVFASKENFDAHVRQLSSLRANYFRSLAACMTLPPERRHGVAKGYYEKFKTELAKFSKSELINPADLVGVFATHAAERTMARVSLAAAASRTDGQFPESAAALASRFSGQVPTSPYDGSPIVYEQLNGGADFSVTIRGAKSEDVELSPVQFSSAGR